MRGLMKAVAIAAALGLTATVFGQDGTGGTSDPLAAFGILGPIIAIILAVIWVQWGGLKWILPGNL